MPVYQSDPDRAPDADFEPGELCHLALGNRARLLDARRTPLTIVAVLVDEGAFVARIDAFEDAGATWKVPLEEVDRYQFALGSQRAGADDIATMRAAIARFDRPLSVPVDPVARADAEARIGAARDEARRWLAAHSTFLTGGGALPDPATRIGDARLWHDLEAFMEARGCAAIEDAFSTTFVRNPYSGDLVRGHRIVLAELGLTAYVGKAPREPGVFEGEWSRARRAEHLVARLAFVRALFDHLGRSHLTLYRGLSTESQVRARDHAALISTTFDRAVAESHYQAFGPAGAGLLARQPVPVERLLMTYLETRAMNANYREAEAVLLADPGNTLF